MNREPERPPGAPHPDPKMAARGWRVGRWGLYQRVGGHGEVETLIGPCCGPDADREAGG